MFYVSSLKKAKYSNTIQDLVVVDLVSINADDSFVIVQPDGFSYLSVIVIC